MKIKVYFLLMALCVFHLDFFSQEKQSTDIKVNPTKSIKNNGTQNITKKGTIYNWWRFLWRQGIDMSAFDTIANELINSNLDYNYEAQLIDKAFKKLQEIQENPIFIKNTKGKKTPFNQQKTNWNFYHGFDGTSNGFSPDQGPSTGEIVWKFPKTNGWKAAPILIDDKVYTTGAGSNVVAFCFDANSGKVIWKGKQASESFYYNSGKRFTPEIYKNKMIVRSGANSLVFNKHSGNLTSTVKITDRDSKNIPTNIYSYQLNNTNIIGSNSDTGTVIWSFKPTGFVSGNPVEDTKYVYTASTEGFYYKLDKISGNIIWKKQLNKPLFGDLSIGKKLVYIQGKNGNIFAIDKINGALKWKFQSKEKNEKAYFFYSEGIEKNNTLYIGTATNKVIAINIKNGKLLWEIATKDWVRSKPIFVDQTLFFATLSGEISAVDTHCKTPKIKWSKKIADHGFMANLSVNKTVLVGIDTNMFIYGLDIKSGKKLWQQSVLNGIWLKNKFIATEEVTGQQSSPTIVDDILYIASPDGFLNAVDINTGKEKWKFELGSDISTSPTVAFGMVFIGQTYTSYGEYYALDKNTGKVIWKTKEFGSVWVSPIASKNTLFLGNMNGDFFSFNPFTGEKKWNYQTQNDSDQINLPKHLKTHGWPPGIHCNPAIDKNTVYTGSWSGYYYAFNITTGKLKWKCKTKPENTNGGLPDSAAPVLHKQYLYVQKEGNKIAAIDKKTGIINWEWNAPLGFLQNGTIAAHKNMIFGSAIRGVTNLPFNATIYAFYDVENQSKLLWEFKGGGGLTAPVLTNDKIIFGSSADPFITCLNPVSGEIIWKTKVGGIMLESVPSIYGNRVYALIKDGYLYAIN